MGIVVGIGKQVREVLVRGRVLRVTTIAIPSRELRRETQVLVASSTVRTGTAGLGEPGDTDPIPDHEPVGTGSARVDHAHDLVAGRDVVVLRRQVTLGQMQISPAHAGGRDPDPDLSAPGSGIGRVTTRSGAPATGPGRSTIHARMLIHARALRPPRARPTPTCRSRRPWARDRQSRPCAAPPRASRPMDPFRWPIARSRARRSTSPGASQRSSTRSLAVSSATPRAASRQRRVLHDASRTTGSPRARSARARSNSPR